MPVLCMTVLFIALVPAGSQLLFVSRDLWCGAGIGLPHLTQKGFLGSRSLTLGTCRPGRKIFLLIVIFSMHLVLPFSGFLKHLPGPYAGADSGLGSHSAHASGE